MTFETLNGPVRTLLYVSVASPEMLFIIIVLFSVCDGQIYITGAILSPQWLCPRINLGVIRCLSMPQDRNNDDRLKMKTIMHQNLGMRAELQV